MYQKPSRSISLCQPQNTSVLYDLAHHTDLQSAEWGETFSTQAGHTLLSFLLTSTLYLNAICTQDMGSLHSDKKLIPPLIFTCVSCSPFISDLLLINTTQP